MKYIKHIYYSLIGLIVIATTQNAMATPEFSQFTGNKCSMCHVNEAGGGARTNFGYNYSRDASIYTANDIKFLENINENQLFNGLLMYGMDFRFQTSRSHKSPSAKRQYFPMQAAAYLTLNPISSIVISGQYNIGPIIFGGQKSWAANLKWTPHEDYPYLRFGYFQPAMGLKEPDMTALDRRVAGSDGTINLIAPDFADLGFEIGYDALDWLTLQFGLFNNQTLKEVSILGDLFPLIPENDKAITSRIVLRPEFIREYIPEFYIGGSNLTCGVFTYNTFFVGFNPYEDFLFHFKFANSNKAFSRYTQSYVAGLTYMLSPGMLINLKAQYGYSDLLWDKTEKHYLRSDDVFLASLGTKCFITPFLELIAEYRFLQCTEFRSGRWLAQIHLYY